ncbi:RGS domain-containing protein [Helicostylum pulchrum]|nr:RGS domain-containing protein [Helicostylum pulchrum]
MFGTDSTTLSLESILEDTDSDLFKDFATYLHQSYCIENLAFWLARQEYYQECSEKKKELCQSMIHLYIRPNSTQEINIPCDMRQSILDDYHSENYHLHIFDDAAEAVLELMRVNSFLPWTTTTTTSTSSSPPTWSFDNIMSSSSSSSSSSCSTKTTKQQQQHKSWPSPRKFVQSTNSLSSSFSFSEKWNLIKLKQPSISRKSCSSLDYIHSSSDSNRLSDNNNLFSVPSASSSSTTTTSATTRYRSMLKRVKKSLLGNQQEFIHPRSSFIEDDTTSTSWSWRKS